MVVGTGMDFLAGGELAPMEQANGHVEQGVEDDPDAAEAPQVAPITSLPDAGTYDPNYMLGGGVETPASTREEGSHSFAEGDIPLGTAGFNPKLSCVAANPCKLSVALTSPSLTVASIHSVSVDSEWEDKTASERKTRQEAAVKKEAEMKAAATAALAEHRAQREKAAADTLAANKAAEEAQAAEAAGETNPWNTICAHPNRASTYRYSTRNPIFALMADRTFAGAIEQTRWLKSTSTPMCTPGTRGITIYC